MTALRIYGDSLPLPSTTVPYEATYPVLLAREHGLDLFHRCRGGTAIAEVVELMSADLGYPMNGSVIVHLGIVDCAPRPVPPGVRRLIGRLYVPIRQRVVVLLNRNRARIVRVVRWRNTPPRAFDFHLGQITDMFPDAIFVGIATPTKILEAVNPGITSEVERYNRMLRARAARFLSVSDLGQEHLDTDGHHLTILGHQELARRLSSLL